MGVSMRFIHNLFSVHLGYTCNDRLGFCFVHEQWSCAFFWLLIRNGYTELRMCRLIYTKRYASILLHHSIPPFHSTIPFRIPVRHSIPLNPDPHIQVFIVTILSMPLWLISCPVKLTTWSYPKPHHAHG